MFFKIGLSNTEAAKNGMISFCERYCDGSVNLRLNEDTEVLTAQNAEVAAVLINYLRLWQASKDPYKCIKPISEKLSNYFRTYSLIYINRVNKLIIFVDEDTNAIYNDGYLMVSCGSLPDIDAKSNFDTVLDKLMKDHIGGDVRIEAEECS